MAAVFHIRKISSVEEVAYFIEMEVKEGWKPGIDDAECYYVADPTGFFVGELDGKKIATVSLVKNENKLAAFIGIFVVEVSFRGKGYGKKMFEMALASCDPSYNIGLDAITKYAGLYEEYGFKKAWTHSQYKIDPAVVVATSLAKHSDIIVKPAVEVDFSQLVNYDALMFGSLRHSFLKKWITAPHSRNFAAVNSNGELLGYTVIRKVVGADQGYKIGPLFANEPDVARHLLTAAAEFASTTPYDRYVYIIVPVDRNSQAVELVKEMNGVYGFSAY